MDSAEDEANASPDEPAEAPGEISDDLRAALGDLLASQDEDDADDEDDGLDLSALEEAVAELGIDVEDDAPARPTHGLDLTELPPPAGPAAMSTPPPDDMPPLEFDMRGDDGDEDLPPAPPPPPARDEAPPPMFGAPEERQPPARKLPPLGQASADDLFGPLDDAPAPMDSPEPLAEPSPVEPEAADSPEEASPEEASDPIQLPAPQGSPPPAGPTSDEVVAFAAHKGRLSGEIASKARKLFGR